MKITWLGQAGLLFEGDGKKILIDPYLSDNVKNFEPQNYRRVPVDERFLSIKPDVIVVTHNHLDHLDKETKAFSKEIAGHRIYKYDIPHTFSFHTKTKKSVDIVAINIR